ncbi:hypothetical protein [Dactylosporangium sp. NPDC005555]|uniref:hypothetical protein n=1 Tax=Dactylosporangium sp. NPDC005555 TaxID=3154889 RepID=UPI0033B17164
MSLFVDVGSGRWTPVCASLRMVGERQPGEAADAMLAFWIDFLQTPNDVEAAARTRH